MTIREAIIFLLKTDLLKINTANGYTRTISLVEAQPLDINKINDFESITASFTVGTAIYDEGANEGNIKGEVSALFQVYIETNQDIDKENLIISEAETWLKNFDWYFYGGNDIDISKRCALKTIPGISRYIIKAQDPQYSSAGTRQSAALVLRIFFRQSKGIIGSFSITPIEVPAQVILSSPADGYTAGNPDDADFIWNAAARAETYQLQVSTDINFISAVYDQAGINFLKHTVIDGLLNYDVQYYWRARARNTAGYGPWSATRSWKAVAGAQEPETISLHARMQTAPSDIRSGLDNDFIKGLKDDGLWDKLDILYVFAAHTNNNGEALLNWKGPSYNATLMNAGGFTFTANKGLAGNGGAGAGAPYIKTGYRPATHGISYQRNSAHIGIYNRTHNVANYPDCGINNNTQIYLTLGLVFGSTIHGSGNDFWLTITNSEPQGFWILSRTGAGAATAYKNSGSVFQSSIKASIPLSNLEFWISTINSNDATVGQVSLREYSLFTLGAGLTQEEVVKFNARVQTFLGLIGAGI